MDNNDLLSESELEKVIQEAKNPIYSDPHLTIIGRNKTDIIRVSPSKGLILINGNSRTGYIHIIDRHDSIYNKPSWKKRTKDGKDSYILTNPSRFSVSIIPYFDCIKIAENLYDSQYCSSQKNTNPEFTDVFEGEVKLGHIECATYRLILYKDTKVIHSLYPTTDKFTPKKIINYRRGSASSTYIVSKCISYVKVPYFDHKKTPIFIMIFRFDNYNLNEKLYIQINTFSGVPIITKFIRERKLNNQIDHQLIDLQINQTDLSQIEEMIDQIAKYYNQK